MASNGSSRSQSKNSAARPNTKVAKRKTEPGSPDPLRGAVAGDGVGRDGVGRDGVREPAGAPGEAEETWTLRLYVAGDSPKSRAAISNLQRLCEAHLAGKKKYEIEVIDLKTRPELAKAHQILALPTLIRKVPEPVKRVIGDLSNADRTLIGLEIAEA